MNHASPQFQIRVVKATPALAPDLRHIRLEALKNHPTAFSADYDADAITDWAKRIDQPRGGIFLAFVDDHPIGMTGIFHGGSPKTRHSGIIWGVYVSPAYRRAGVARNLMDAAIRWAREHAIDIVKLAVVTENKAALAFYKGLGFEIYGTEPNALLFEGIGYDEYMMAKELT